MMYCAGTRSQEKNEKEREEERESGRGEGEKRRAVLVEIKNLVLPIFPNLACLVPRGGGWGSSFSSQLEIERSQ